MSVAQAVTTLLVLAVVVVGAVLVWRWFSRSQAAAIAAQTQADQKDFDAKRAELMTPTPEEKVAKLTPDQVTDEANKL